MELLYDEQFLSSAATEDLASKAKQKKSQQTSTSNEADMASGVARDDSIDPSSVEMARDEEVSAIGSCLRVTVDEALEPNEIFSKWKKVKMKVNNITSKSSLLI